jgi:hypothetical protein
MIMPPFRQSASLGQGLQEYGLILGLAVIIAVPLLMTLGNQAVQPIAAVNQSSPHLHRLTSLLSENVETAGAPGDGTDNTDLTPAGRGVTTNGQTFEIRLNPQTNQLEASPVVSSGKGPLNSVPENTGGNTTSVNGVVNSLLDELETQLASGLGADGQPMTPTHRERLRGLLETGRTLQQQTQAIQSMLPPAPPPTPNRLSPSAPSADLDPQMQEAMASKLAALKQKYGGFLQNATNAVQDKTLTTAVPNLQSTLSLLANANYYNVLQNPSLATLLRSSAPPPPPNLSLSQLSRLSQTVERSALLPR